MVITLMPVPFRITHAKFVQDKKVTFVLLSHIVEQH